ncbi:MAG: type II secretion system F family protein [Gemmataceae bacterium]|nr:type II secretion system F family protein [Gemmataceae bacterium]
MAKLSLAAVIELSRVLRHYLHSGLPLPAVFRQQATNGPREARPVAGRIAERLEQGDSLADALSPDAALFPPVFVSLASVGEQTGAMPEVFAELERYFARQKQLVRAFLGQIAWPVFQFFAAVFVLAFLIYFLGQLSINTGSGKGYDPLGFGLLGASGAAIFLAIVFGTLGLGWLIVALLRRSLSGKASFDRFLLGVPMLGPCLRALALSRFSLSLRLASEAGMSIGKGMRMAMNATGNAAFIDAAKTAAGTVKKGDDVTMALGATRLFPDDYLSIISVAEEAGSLSEVLKQQAEYYHEEASRRLGALAAAAGYVVWAVVAAFLIFAIFRLYLSRFSALEGLPF